MTCCTGLYAPGLDFEIVDHLGLPVGVERTMVGFMGCHAAINALKRARHTVRSDPNAAVLLVNMELCRLHLQEAQQLEQVLSFLVFADGEPHYSVRAWLCVGQLQGGYGVGDTWADSLEDSRARFRHAALRAARMRDVVWPGAYSGDDALPCGLVQRSTSDGGSLRAICRS